jgi:hypothetical protein
MASFLPARRSVAWATSSGDGSSPPFCLVGSPRAPEQATAEYIDTEQAIRMTGFDPNPWDAGAVASILPDLANALKIDWSKPLAEWPREMMVEFLTTALALIRKAMIARDLSEKGITRTNTIAHQANAAAAGAYEPSKPKRRVRF